MKRTRVVGFSENRMKQRLTKLVVEEQTRRLVEYAQHELLLMLSSKDFNNRTWNAADSYIWAVYYDGKLQKKGFQGKRGASQSSYLHEWTPSLRQPVNGRALAEAFASNYVPRVTKGWEIVWCAAAPYTAYLEGGFRIGGTYYQFNVMSQRYDHIRRTLGNKCEVVMEVNQPQY